MWDKEVAEDNNTIGYSSGIERLGKRRNEGQPRLQEPGDVVAMHQGSQGKVCEWRRKIRLER